MYLEDPETVTGAGHYLCPTVLFEAVHTCVMGTLSRVAEPFWTREFVAKQLWLLIGVVTFGLVLFAAALDFDALARVIVAVGWFLLTPIFLFFGSHIADTVFEDEEAEPVESDDPIETLQDRYARGEITEAEFERRVEGLLETEGSADASARREREPAYE